MSREPNECARKRETRARLQIYIARDQGELQKVKAQIRALDMQRETLRGQIEQIENAPATETYDSPGQYRRRGRKPDLRRLVARVGRAGVGTVAAGADRVARIMALQNQRHVLGLRRERLLSEETKLTDSINKAIVGRATLREEMDDLACDRR